jgi:hypothetical protein
MTKKKAVCLLSGGLDSSVMAFLARQQGYEIYGLSFRYGQRHVKELNCAKKIAKRVGAKAHLVFDVNLSRFGGHPFLLPRRALFGIIQYRISVEQFPRRMFLHGTPCFSLLRSRTRRLFMLMRFSSGQTPWITQDTLTAGQSISVYSSSLRRLPLEKESREKRSVSRHRY